MTTSRPCWRSGVLRLPAQPNDNQDPPSAACGGGQNSRLGWRTMKVALFFDGKNFYSGWRERASRQPLDFTALSRWLVRRVGGTLLWGAYYYTGIEIGASSSGTGQA